MEEVLVLNPWYSKNKSHTWYYAFLLFKIIQWLPTFLWEPNFIIHFKHSTWLCPSLSLYGFNMSALILFTGLCSLPYTRKSVYSASSSSFLTSHQGKGSLIYAPIHSKYLQCQTYLITFVFLVTLIKCTYFTSTDNIEKQ